MRRILQFSILLVCCLAGIIWFNSGHSQSASVEQSRSNNRPLTVQAEYLTPHQSLEKNRTYTGIVKAQRQSQLSFELSGKLTSIHVDEGDVVESGQALAIIEADRLNTKQKQLQAKLKNAESLLSELERGPRAQTIKSARSLVSELEALRDLAERKMERSKQLVDQGAITAQNFDEFYFDYVSLKEKALSAQHQLDEYEEGTRPEKVTAQRAIVEELKANLQEINIDIQDTTLQAPYAGTIIKRFADEGDVVVQAQTVFELIENSALEIRIGMPVAATQALTNHTEFEVEIDDKLYKTRLHRVLPSLSEKTRTQTVIFHFTEPVENSVFSGQLARLHFTEQIDQNGFWIPTNALVKGNRGLWSCYVLIKHSEDNIDPTRYVIERRDIEELYTHAGRMFVTGTLQDGDLVLTQGAHRVVAGQEVKWTGATETQGEK